MLSVSDINNDHNFGNSTWLALTKEVDFINVKAYGLQPTISNKTGFASPLLLGNDFPFSSDQDPKYSVKGVMDSMVNADVPLSAINLGVQFNGEEWSQVVDLNNGLYQTAVYKGPLEYTDLIKNYTYKQGYSKLKHVGSQVPYLYNPFKKSWISFEDEDSISKKMEWMIGYSKFKQFNGTMIADLSYDRSGDLLSVVSDKMHVQQESEQGENFIIESLGMATVQALILLVSLVFAIMTGLWLASRYNKKASRWLKAKEKQILEKKKAVQVWIHKKIDLDERRYDQDLSEVNTTQ